jgi:glutamate synthase (NADPH/NADH) large chain
VVGSEAGMVKVDEQTLVEKGRVGPGQMIAVNLVEGKFYRDAELKEWLARSRPFGDWTRNITVMKEVMSKPNTRQQVCVGEKCIAEC